MKRLKARKFNPGVSASEYMEVHCATCGHRAIEHATRLAGLPHFGRHERSWRFGICRHQDCHGYPWCLYRPCVTHCLTHRKR